MKPSVTLIVIVILSILGTALFLLRQMNVGILTNPQTPPSTQEPIKVIATGLEVPWALAFLPNNDLLITERRGSVKLLKTDGQIADVGKISGVKQITESGLHGLALDPDFSINQYVYFYYTYGETSGNTQNKVVRLRFDGQTLTDETTIIDNIPGAPIHNGGRLKFGPDGYLYITTGDAANPSLSQAKGSLAGKILRVTNEGKPAPGNPFNTSVYSYGHRNPQGIAWNSSGKLWETEHGQSATDEVNQIEPGKNYGWPEIIGEQTKIGMETPKIQSDQSTWAPAGATIHKTSLFFAGLRGQALFELNLDNLELKEHFKGEFGRIRDVVLGPDDFLYITTSNKDGRGRPGQDDDKIIRINPKNLNSF